MTSPWLQTIHPHRATRRFDLVNPTAAMVHFPTMALVLSRIPRFGGHTECGVYSVAQHSVEGADAIMRDGYTREVAVAFLLHDGHEYITGDFATPIQQALAVHAELASGNIYAGEMIGTAIRALKTALDAVIYEAAGIAWPLPPVVRAIVKKYDARMCNTERLARLDVEPCEWGAVGELPIVRGCDLTPWGQAVAQGRFLHALHQFGLPCL